MAINFPSGATTNDVYTSDGYSWVFDGSKWNSVQYEQPMDDGLFSIINKKVPSSYLTNDGINVYWDDPFASIYSYVDASISSYTTLTTNLQTGTSYTLVLTDQNDLIEMSSASTNSVTIPLNSSVAFPIGTQITILSTGAGATTVVVAGGVTLNCTPQTTANTATLRAQWSSVQLIKRATDTWVALGDLV